MAEKGRRILLTGVSRFLGTGLATLLERHPDVDELVAVDKAGPVNELARTDIIQAEVTHSLIRKLVRQLDIDTVVHATTSGNTSRNSARQLHDANVIGTMQVLAGCSGADSPVTTFVHVSSTAIYGGGQKNPAMWSETMALPATPRTWYERDLREAERYVRDFQSSQPQTTTTILRLADIVGPDSESLLERYLSLPLVPTVFGFDPVIQVLHQDDALDALAKATMRPHGGTYNVAPRGVIPVSQAIEVMGRQQAPLIPFAGQELFVAATMPFARGLFPPHFLRMLQYGWCADPQVWESVWGTKATYSSLDAVNQFAMQSRTRKLQDDQVPYVYEAQLEEFLRSKGRNHVMSALPAAPSSN